MLLRCVMGYNDILTCLVNSLIFLSAASHDVLSPKSFLFLSLFQTSRREIQQFTINTLYLAKPANPQGKKRAARHVKTWESSTEE